MSENHTSIEPTSPMHTDLSPLSPSDSVDLSSDPKTGVSPVSNVGNSALALSGDNSMHTSPNKAGYLLKKRGLTGVFSKRFIQVKGGLISWTKPDDVHNNLNVSCRVIAGAVVHIVTEDTRLFKKQSGAFIFVVYMAYDSRKVHVPPLILSAESEVEMNSWVSAIRSASGWMYHPSSMCPLPLRLCGLLVIEVISVENVLAADWRGTSDPYVLIEYDGLFGRTITHYASLSSEYNEIISLPVYNDDPNMSINFLCFDEDVIKIDDLLGGVCVPLHSLGFNKEIVWDSVPLRALPGSIAGRRSVGSDQYGSISFRTLYRSSKVTQLLPLRQTPSLINSVDVAAHASLQPEYRRMGTSVIRGLSVSKRQSVYLDEPPSATKGRDRAPSSDEDSPTSASVKTPRRSSFFASFSSATEAAPIQEDMSPSSSPAGSPGPSAGGDLDPSADAGYEFSIEMFKAQLMRIVMLLKIFSMLKAIGYFFAWRDPSWTVLVFSWITWVSFLEPQSALMFYFALLGKLLLQAHPSYPVLLAEMESKLHRVQSVWRKWTSHFSGKPRAMSMTSALTGLASKEKHLPCEYRVYECQRRRIANAMTMISTMVRVTTVVPAQMAMAAGSAVASPLLPSKDEEDDDHPSSPGSPNNVTESVRKDMEILFKNFSGKNLKEKTEAEWVTMTGVAMQESPSTVMDGVKIKWTVDVKKNATDKNGWEYGKQMAALTPASGGTDESALFDPKKPLWGSTSGLKFEPKLKIHRHWVRRRVWVGVPIRPAFESEEAVRLSQVVDSAGETDDLTDNRHQHKSLYAKFRLIMEEGRKLQNVLFDVASKLESFKNLVSWKSRWISSLIFWVLMVLLALSLLVSQFVLVWLIMFLVLVDHLTDTKKKMKLTKPLIDAVLAEVATGNTKVPGQWKKLLAEKLPSYFTKMEDILSEVSVSIVCSLFQKACDKVWYTNAVVLTMNDFDTTTDAEGGPVTVGMLVEKVYLMANHGDSDWWKSEKIGVHPKNLFKGHLVSDWEEFNPQSVFAK